MALQYLLVMLITLLFSSKTVPLGKGAIVSKWVNLSKQDKLH